MLCNKKILDFSYLWHVFVCHQRIRQLVPGMQAPHPAGDGEDHEGEPRAVRVARTDPQGAAAILLGAHRAVSLQPELWRTVLQSDHLVSTLL